MVNQKVVRAYRELAVAILNRYEKDKRLSRQTMLRNKKRLCEKVYRSNLSDDMYKTRVYQSFQTYERQFEDYCNDLQFEDSQLFELCVDFLQPEVNSATVELHIE